jgi:hypothetical protein
MDALRLLSSGFAMLAGKFGTVAITIDTFPEPIETHWTDLGKTEVLEINGRRVSFSVLVQFTRSQLPAGRMPRQGQTVTRADDGTVYKISGEVQADALTVRFALQSRNA